MQLLLTSAANSNIGQGGDTIKLKIVCRLAQWVKLIFSVSRIVIFAQGPCSLHAQFSSQLDLCVSSLSKPYLCIVKKTTQILTVILVQGPCSNIQSHSVQKKKLRHPCAGAMQQCPAEDKASGSSRSSYLRTSIRGFHRFAPREHHGRSFWRE